MDFASDELGSATRLNDESRFVFDPKRALQLTGLLAQNRFLPLARCHLTPRNDTTLLVIFSK